MNSSLVGVSQNIHRDYRRMYWEHWLGWGTGEYTTAQLWEMMQVVAYIKIISYPHLRPKVAFQ